MIQFRVKRESEKFEKFEKFEPRRRGHKKSPSGCVGRKGMLCSTSFLGEVDVVEDVILTEAVVARALAAIAELEIGVVRVGAAADGALVVVALFLLLLLYRLLVLHGLGVVLRLGAGGQIVYLRPDEHGEVQQRHHRQHHARPVVLADGADDVKGEQCAVQIGQPLHFHRQEEHEKHRGVREQHGEGEEHGQVHIGGARHGDEIVAGDDAGQHRTQHRQQHAAEVVEIELGGAPLPLQRGADPVVEVQADEQPEGGAGAGVENERHDAPDLAVEQAVQVKRQKVQRGGVGGCRQHGQDVHRHVADDDDAHQIGDTEAGVGGAETLHPVIELFQGELPPV
mgnify:CR=1 FL=1